MKCPTTVIAVPPNNENNRVMCSILYLLFNVYRAYIATAWYKQFSNVFVNNFLFYLNNIFYN